ncbi:putative helicase mov-10-B.1 isoform X1 [Alosa sapidissima]|uniref:putative helicase mov-10-B.1 isoform X1 n=2 Tax=Alosa sapidissima TaxID=34773 RepID=UPI001C08A286|nr:putative helicase mov-10-B.1 isoform X1 [Alosa sapidissima]XP_041952752.1 putative helicase mov-10-B.1 isoform X1 [Alosa sapidissima]XP_041952754.1 putative helicase mov-10-B.1 isoform X1 [Alosa sapidissima]
MSFKWREIRQVGLNFVDYLDKTDRRSVRFEKEDLRGFYNYEFKDGGCRYPPFSRVLYVLKCHGDIRGCAGLIELDHQVKLYDQRNMTSSASSRPKPANQVLLVQDQFSMEVVDLTFLLTEDRALLIAEKYGISITSSVLVVDGTIRMSVRTDQVYELKLYVANTANTAMLLTHCSFLKTVPCFSLEVTRDRPLLLQPGAREEVNIRIKTEQVGCYQEALAFQFRSQEPESEPFHIVRFLEVEHASPLMETLAPTAPYIPVERSVCREERFTVEDGERPDDMRNSGLTWVRPLQEHRVPPYVGDLIKFLAKQGCSATMKHKLLVLKGLLESPLSFENYTSRFQLLLQLEENQMLVDIRAYDMQDAKMVRDKKLLVLKVPGVAENRPSVLRGDHLLVICSKERYLVPLRKHKGYVHQVELDQVKLGFGQKLLRDFVDGMGFDVEFTVNRLPVRLQHRAVELATEHHLRDLLFPTGAKVTAPAELPRLRLRDRKLESNSEQYSAVKSIVASVSRPAPYLLFGPPGTGKTVTVVEAIKQLYDSPSCSHILACAPSNSAADLLCERILEHVDKGQVYRLYASSRDPKTIPQPLRDRCNLSGDGFVFPCKEELMKYKILVTTVVTAGRLVSGGLPTGHFSHIFVDEAGHATEPDTIISVAGLLDPKSGQLVLAGDPKQLGPILRSPIAKKHGLEVSLLERLMNHNSLYQKDEKTGHYNSRYVTKLLLNYRSHKSILKIPNDLFYDGELVASADEMSTHMYCTWEHLPKQNFPLIFHGVIGKDEREANSPSFFNRSEIDVVMGYLKKLLLEAQGKKGVARISPKDIGIIAPYRKQVLKIRQAIRELRELREREDINLLKVGSVEEFQGQERRVIIVSCVRSSGELLTFDQKFNIGFLKNEKRFNVAMTRAKALLIVVGNPVILRTDPTWGSFIRYCVEQGGYTGCPLSDSPPDGALQAQLAALHLEPEEQVDIGESVVQQLLDPEWRNEQ